MFAPTGCVNDVIYPKALETRLIHIRQAEEKDPQYDFYDENRSAIWHLRDRLSRRRATVIFTEMDLKEGKVRRVVRVSKTCRCTYR